MLYIFYCQESQALLILKNEFFYMGASRRKKIKGIHIEGIVIKTHDRKSEHSENWFTDIVVRDKETGINVPVSIKGSHPIEEDNLIRIIYDQFPKTKFAKYYALLNETYKGKIIYECANCGM